MEDNTRRHVDTATNPQRRRFSLIAAMRGIRKGLTDRAYFAISLAAAIAASTPDFFRIALILARDPLERFRREAMYRP